MSTPTREEAAGQLHWLAIDPAYGGRGLAQAATSLVMDQFAARGHQRAFLKTQSKRQAAIHIYKKFGFRPFIQNDADRAAWN